MTDLMKEEQVRCGGGGGEDKPEESEMENVVLDWVPGTQTVT